VQLSLEEHGWACAQGGRLGILAPGFRGGGAWLGRLAFGSGLRRLDLRLLLEFLNQGDVRRGIVHSPEAGELIDFPNLACVQALGAQGIVKRIKLRCSLGRDCFGRRRGVDLGRRFFRRGSGRGRWRVDAGRERPQRNGSRRIYGARIIRLCRHRNRSCRCGPHHPVDLKQPRFFSHGRRRAIPAQGHLILWSGIVRRCMSLRSVLLVCRGSCGRGPPRCDQGWKYYPHVLLQPAPPRSRLARIVALQPEGRWECGCIVVVGRAKNSLRGNRRGCAGAEQCGVTPVLKVTSPPVRLPVVLPEIPPDPPAWKNSRRPLPAL